MNRQVITVHADGNMSGLQRKPGQGIDLRSFGHAEIERASLVEWDAKAQAWYINVLTGAVKGPLLACEFQEAIDNEDPDWGALRSTLDELCPSGWGGNSYEAAPDSKDRYFNFDDVLIFVEYDEAVKVEITYLDALRLKGQF